jgi:acyl carrier protein
MNLDAELRAMLAEQLAVEEAEVVPGARLQDDLGADSLLLVDLAERIGKRWGITILPDELADVANVGDLEKLVRAKLPG